MGKYIATVDPSNDPFLAVTQSMVTEALELETKIIQEQGRIQFNYFDLGRMIVEFRDKKLYLARNYTSFKDWADSPELQGMNSRTAYNLVRIVDELLPLFEEFGLMGQLPPLSMLYDLLPILNDENSKEKFVQAVQQIVGLTNKDAKKVIKQIRGIDPNSKVAYFKLVVLGESQTHYECEIWCTTPNLYKVSQTVERIAKADWPRFEALFKGYVEFQTA